jgi:hypothetical protein
MKMADEWEPELLIVEDADVSARPPLLSAARGKKPQKRLPKDLSCWSSTQIRFFLDAVHSHKAHLKTKVPYATKFEKVGGQ